MAKGQLPGEGSVRLGPVTLPWGRLIRAHEGEGETVAWATDDPVPDAGRIWAVLSGLHPQTGLVPILLDGLEGDTRQPWDEGEFSDALNLSGIDRLDPGRVLGGLWARGLDTLSGGGQENPDFARLRAPFTRDFPRLAPSGGAPLTPAERQHALDVLLADMRLTSLPQPAARIGLVAADRPADVLPAIGWWGVANRGMSFCCRSRRSCARGRTGSVPALSMSDSLRFGCWSSGLRGSWRRRSGSLPSTMCSRTEVVKGSRLSPGLRLAWSTRLSGPSGGTDQGAQARGPGCGTPRGGGPQRRR